MSSVAEMCCGFEDKRHHLLYLYKKGSELYLSLLMHWYTQGLYTQGYILYAFTMYFFYISGTENVV